jgi:hypothetical protein
MNADAPDVLPSQRPIFESQFLEMRGHQHGRYREVNPLKELIARLIMAEKRMAPTPDGGERVPVVIRSPLSLAG